MSAPEKAIRLLIVKDSPDDVQRILTHLQRYGFAPKHKVVESGPAFAAALAESEWDAILSDFSMSHIDGLRVLDLQLAKAAGIPFVFVSKCIGAECVAEAMRLGAAGYVSMDRLARLPSVIEREQRLRIQRRLQNTGGVSGSALSDHRCLPADREGEGTIGPISFPSDVPPEALSPRQREVLLLVAEGCTSREIAQSLVVSAKTAEAHRAQLMEKLGIRTTAGLVRYAVRHRLIRP